VPVRDAEATQARILAAAAKEFAAKGVSGARIDEIAARARTNKRMLYYYFGSKAELFREVLRRELTARVVKAREVEGDRVERLVTRQARHADDTAWVRLLQWEALEVRRKDAPDDGERAASYADAVDRVRQEQAAGTVPADLDAAQLVLTELALTLFPVAFPQLTRWITGHEVGDAEFVAERQAFLRTLGERFLTT
jgi:AcrR family transcriptional regulator